MGRLTVYFLVSSVFSSCECSVRCLFLPNPCEFICRGETAPPSPNYCPQPVCICPPDAGLRPIQPDSAGR